MLMELQYCLRSLLRTPVILAAAVLILALAVGANAAVFSLMFGLVLRTLPVASAPELVQVSTRDSLGRVSDMTSR